MSVTVKTEFDIEALGDPKEWRITDLYWWADEILSNSSNSVFIRYFIGSREYFVRIVCEMYPSPTLYEFGTVSFSKSSFEQFEDKKALVHQKTIELNKSFYKNNKVVDCHYSGGLQVAYFLYADHQTDDGLTEGDVYLSGLCLEATDFDDGSGTVIIHILPAGMPCELTVIGAPFEYPKCNYEYFLSGYRIEKTLL